MLSLSTCSLIPLLTAGQQVNWYPPPHRRWGSTLMKLCLGAPVLAGDTHGVMISSVAPSHRIWLPQSSPGCLLMLTGPSQFNTAQQVCRHTDWQCGDTQVHMKVKCCFQKHMHAHTGFSCVRFNLGARLSAQKYRGTNITSEQYLLLLITILITTLHSIMLKTGHVVS